VFTIETYLTSLLTLVNIIFNFNKKLDNDTKLYNLKTRLV